MLHIPKQTSTLSSTRAFTPDKGRMKGRGEKKGKINKSENENLPLKRDLERHADAIRSPFSHGILGKCDNKAFREEKRQLGGYVTNPNFI